MEVNIIVSEKEYQEYRSNPLNSLESYMRRSISLPILVGEAKNNTKEPIISFLHRSGIKITLNPEKQDIYR